jgi:hypothetical protein
MSFPMGIVGPSLKGFMLAIDIASTYGPMDSLMYIELMTSGEICNKVCLLTPTDPSLVDPPESLLLLF